MSDFVDPNPDLKDRRKAKYFHGRKGIPGRFHRRLKWAEKDPSEGTTFLIQAAPGAGKTALLHECTKLAENTGWGAVLLNTQALWDTDTMCQRLGDGCLCLTRLPVRVDLINGFKSRGPRSLSSPVTPLRVSSNGGRIRSCYSWTRRKRWGRGWPHGCALRDREGVS